MTERMGKELLPWRSVVQINPEKCTMFAGCFLLVEEIEDWGVFGSIAIPHSPNEPPNDAPFKAKWDEIEWIGTSRF